MYLEKGALSDAIRDTTRIDVKTYILDNYNFFLL